MLHKNPKVQKALRNISAFLNLRLTRFDSGRTSYHGRTAIFADSLRKDIERVIIFPLYGNHNNGFVVNVFFKPSEKYEKAHYYWVSPKGNRVLKFQEAVWKRTRSEEFPGKLNPMTKSMSMKNAPSR